MPSRWEEYVTRARVQHGDRLDLSDVSSKFLPYFRGARIRVNFGTASEPFLKTGTVAITTGWKPSLMLMLRADSIGSSWLLSERNELVAVQRRGVYVPVTAPPDGRGHAARN